MLLTSKDHSSANTDIHWSHLSCRFDLSPGLMLLAPSQVLLLAFQVATAIHRASTIVAPALPEKSEKERYTQRNHMCNYVHLLYINVYRCVSVDLFFEYVLPSNAGGTQLSDDWCSHLPLLTLDSIDDD